MRDEIVRRAIRTLGVLVCASCLSASAAPSDHKPSELIGTWRGTSTCTDRVAAPACHDEVVVYRITPVKGSDSLSMDALKIVNGKEEEMGVLSCAFAARGASLTCPLRNGLW